MSARDDIEEMARRMINDRTRWPAMVFCRRQSAFPGYCMGHDDCRASYWRGSDAAAVRADMAEQMAVVRHNRRWLVRLGLIARRPDARTALAPCRCPGRQQSEGDPEMSQPAGTEMVEAAQRLSVTSGVTFREALDGLVEVPGLRAAVAAVKQLHEPVGWLAGRNGATVCLHDSQPWPCATRRALGDAS